MSHCSYSGPQVTASILGWQRDDACSPGGGGARGPGCDVHGPLSMGRSQCPLNGPLSTARSQCRPTSLYDTCGVLTFVKCQVQPGSECTMHFVMPVVTQVPCCRPSPVHWPAGGEAPVLRIVSLNASGHRSPSFSIPMADLFPGGQPLSYEAARAVFKVIA